MRFVHVECLTQWRTSSQNRESFFACDSCQYRYSFQRPAWASLLRSALVVHCVAFVLFILLICLCGHTANVADYLFFDGALSLYLGLSFEDEQMEEIMELYGDAYGGLFDSNLSVLGLNWIQLTTGAALVVRTYTPHARNIDMHSVHAHAHAHAHAHLRLTDKTVRRVLEASSRPVSLRLFSGVAVTTEYSCSRSSTGWSIRLCKCTAWSKTAAPHG
jgi:ABC-type uncharacterized transport system permease subunit